MSEMRMGHTLIVGATGAGKTSVLNEVLAKLGMKGNRASRRGKPNQTATSRAKTIGKRAPGARP